MISPELLQMAVITKLKANSALITALGGSGQIKESQWQGPDFTYPAVRVDLNDQIPLGNGTDHLRLSRIFWSVRTYSEKDSSFEANNLLGLVLKALFDTQVIDGVDNYDIPHFNVIRIDSSSTQNAIRVGERLWQAEVFFESEVNDQSVWQLYYTNKVKSIAPNNFVGYWPLSEVSGDYAYDFSADHRTGTYHNAALGRQGMGDGLTAPYFNPPFLSGSSNAWVALYSTGLNNDFNGSEGTISLWAKADLDVWTDGQTRTLAGIFSVIAGNSILFRKTVNNNEILLLYGSTPTIQSVSTTTLGGSHNWFHLAITWSKLADEVRGYVNGVLLGTPQTGLGTWTGSLHTTGVNLATNANIPDALAGLFPWKGHLAHFAWWNTPLSATQIAILATPGVYV